MEGGITLQVSSESLSFLLIVSMLMAPHLFQNRGLTIELCSLQSGEHSCDEVWGTHEGLTHGLIITLTSGAVTCSHWFPAITCYWSSTGANVDCVVRIWPSHVLPFLNCDACEPSNCNELGWKGVWMNKRRADNSWRNLRPPSGTDILHILLPVVASNTVSPFMTRNMNIQSVFNQ